MEIFLFWVVLSVVVGIIASSRGRSGVGWFFVAVLFSPLIAFILVVALPSRAKSSASKSGGFSNFGDDLEVKYTPPKALGWHITYISRNGDETERDIGVKQLLGYPDQPYPRYLYAWCYLRKEHRHFNVYNIVDCIDEDGQEPPVTYKLIEWLKEKERAAEYMEKVTKLEAERSFLYTTGSGEKYVVKLTHFVDMKNGAFLGNRRKIIKSGEPGKRETTVNIYSYTAANGYVDSETGEVIPDWEALKKAFGL